MNLGKSPWFIGKSTINGPFSMVMSAITRDYLSFGHDEPRISLTNRRKWTIPSPSSQGDRHASGSLAANLSSDSWKICENLYVYIHIYIYLHIHIYIYSRMNIYVDMCKYVYIFFFSLSLSLSFGT